MQAGEKVKALVCLRFHYKQAPNAAAGQQSVANTEPACRRSNRSVLLLQRRSKHNDKKWGLPGGNAEDADASLLETAKREAAEEMGDVPDFAVTGVVETRSVCS